MKLEDIYAALVNVENGSEMIDSIKSELTNVREEAAKQRTKKNDILKALGVDNNEKANERINDILNDLQVLKNAGTPDNISAQLTALTKQVETLTKAAEEEKAKAAEEHEKRITAARINEIITAANKHNSVDASMIATLLDKSITKRDDDSFFMISKNDGKEISVDEGVKQFLQSNPYLVKNYQKPGAGSNASASSNEFTKEQIAKMTPEQINANWDAIQASLAKMK